jgi:hypothetical protein
MSDELQYIAKIPYWARVMFKAMFNQVILLPIAVP